MHRNQNLRQSCLSVTTTLLNKINVYTQKINSLNVVSTLLNTIEICTTYINGIMVTAKQQTEPIVVTCSVVCNVKKDFYLDVDPEIVWLSNENDEFGVFTIHSNVIWEIS